MNQSHTFYDRFACLYPMVDFFLKPQKSRLLQEINLLPDGELLDVGVGNGAHLPMYTRHRITGIDTSVQMLRRARRRRSDRTTLLMMDGQSLQFGNGQFDYVVLSHVIAVVENPGQLLREVFRVLKPKGQMIILNHVTPRNWLRYVDRVFGSASPLFHFRSVFQLDDIAEINQFTLLKEIQFKPLSYFKLLVYEKK